MACCEEKPVLELQHGSLCKSHFLNYFEERVFKTMNKFQMILPEDRLCVAVSGGKDSLTVLYLTQKYLQKHHLTLPLFALAVDEGIADYREHTLQDLQRFCTEHHVPLTVVSFQEELGRTLDEAYPVINKDTKKKPCNICGVWRRYLLNKHAQKLGATKVITGHNLDDEAQAIVMNWFKANTDLAARLGPVSGIREHHLFVQRVKPLYLSPEKEVRLYAFLKGFQIQFAECPYSQSGYRHDIQEMLNAFENKYRGTKQGLVNSFLSLLPLLKENSEDAPVGRCSVCSGAATQETCNACRMKEMLHAV